MISLVIQDFGSAYLRIEDEDGDLLVLEARGTSLLQVIDSGVQGPPGPPNTGYTHTQSTPSNVWTVNHNLGYYPSSVSVLSPGNVEVDAEVILVSVNQLSVHFVDPYVGTVRIS